MTFQLFVIVSCVLIFLPLDAKHCMPTPADTHADQLGPYWIKNVPFKGSLVAPRQRLAEEVRLTVSGYVLDSQCNHVACAEVEMWSTDPNGKYSFSEPFWGRGRIKADQNGYYEYTTWYPAYYPGATRPLHIHYMVTPPGGSSFVTQLYFSHDPKARGYPSTIVATTTQKRNSEDHETKWDIVLPSSAATTNPLDTCTPDSGKSLGNAQAMTARQIVDNQASQGSTLFLDEQVTVVDVPATAPGEANELASEQITECSFDAYSFADDQAWDQVPPDAGGVRQSRCNARGGEFTAVPVYTHPENYYTAGFICCPPRGSSVESSKQGSNEVQLFTIRQQNLCFNAGSKRVSLKKCQPNKLSQLFEVKPDGSISHNGSCVSRALVLSPCQPSVSISAVKVPANVANPKGTTHNLLGPNQKQCFRRKKTALKLRKCNYKGKAFKFEVLPQ